MTSAAMPGSIRGTRSSVGRTYGYVRGSNLEDVESPDDQARLIATYCHRIGRDLDEVFVADAVSGSLLTARRKGSRGLLPRLRKGDHIVVARSELLFRSCIELTRVLGECSKLGVVLHLCDLPVGPLDPDDPLSHHLIDFLVLYYGYKRGRIVTRSRDVSRDLEAQGRRNARYARYGFRWEKRGRLTFEVPDPDEQRICLKAAEMRLAGYSWHQIRRHLAYTWKVKNREGNEYGYAEVRELTFRGLELLRAAGSLEANQAVYPS